MMPDERVVFPTSLVPRVKRWVSGAAVSVHNCLGECVRACEYACLCAMTACRTATMAVPAIAVHDQVNVNVTFQVSKQCKSTIQKTTKKLYDGVVM